MESRPEEQGPGVLPAPKLQEGRNPGPVGARVGELVVVRRVEQVEHLERGLGQRLLVPGQAARRLPVFGLVFGGEVSSACSAFSRLSAIQI